MEPNAHAPSKTYGRTLLDTLVGHSFGTLLWGTLECPARVSDKSECPQHVLNAWGGYVALGTCLARSRLGYEFKARIAALIALATSLATPVCLFVC